MEEKSFKGDGVAIMAPCKKELAIQLIMKCATKFNDVYGRLIEHARYRLRRRSKRVKTNHYDRKTLEIKFAAILANCGPDVPKLLAAKLVKQCSDTNIKKTLRMCSRSLKDKGVLPESKINAMQFLLVVALSNEDNAYKVARSNAINLVYKIGTISFDRDSHTLFGRCVNKAQMLKCAMYAKNVIEVLSKTDSYDTVSHHPMPFGMRYLMGKCIKLQMKYLEAGVAALKNEQALNDANNVCSPTAAPLGANERMTSKVCYAKMKEIEYRITLIEDEMRELGVGRGRSARAERDGCNDNQNSEARVEALLQRLSHLRGETEKLVEEMGKCKDYSFHVHMRLLLDRIEDLVAECRGTYMHESEEDNSDSLQITLSELQRQPSSSDAEFHSGRESLDFSYIISLNKGDKMSAYTYKSARTEYTAKETLSSEPTILDLEPDEQAARMQSVLVSRSDIRKVSHFYSEDSVPSDKGRTGKDWTSFGAANFSKVATNDVRTVSTYDAMQDRWATFYGSQEGKINGLSRESDITSQKILNTPNYWMNQNTKQACFKSNSSSNLVSGRSTMSGDVDIEQSKTEECPSASTRKADNTNDGIIASALCVLGIIKKYLSAESDASDTKQSKDTAPSQVMQHGLKGDLPVDSGELLPKLSSLSDGYKSIKGGIINTLKLTQRISLPWGSDNGSVSGESSGRSADSKHQNGRKTFSNTSKIRKLIVSGGSEIYCNNGIKATFRKQLMAEGTGKVVNCHLTLTNMSNQTIEQMHFDFQNFEHFPIHIILSPTETNATVIALGDAMDMRFKLYPLAPFIGIPKIKLVTKTQTEDFQKTHILYLPIALSSFLVAEPIQDMKTVEAFQKQPKDYFVLTNTVDFEKAVGLATLDNIFMPFTLSSEPNTVCFLASLHQSLYENGRNECLSKISVLIKLEATTEPTSFSVHVFSKSDRLAGAVAQLYRYLFHNQRDVYGV